jgi:citrate lyase subunit beta/citryl-CoA lyase
MPSTISDAALFLFVPGDRPERFAKAFSAGADAVILDLEDAVAPDAKARARDAIEAAASEIANAPCAVLLRINAVADAGHAVDVALARRLPVAGVMLAKAERAADVERVAEASSRPVVALVESALGLVALREIAGVAARLAFGTFDYAADLGCRPTREALASARHEFVLASRFKARPAPIDGVTAATRDEALIEADAASAAELGFSAKLLIHPAQIPPAARGFAPGAEAVAWAGRVLDAGQGGGAVSLDGEMVDAPVILRAQAILAAAARAGRGGR